MAIGDFEVIKLRRVSIDLITPSKSAHGTEFSKEATVVELIDKEGRSGFGECVALAKPTYSSEWAQGAWLLLNSVLAPLLLESGREGLGQIVGNPMAKAALAFAISDLEVAQGSESTFASLPRRNLVPTAIVISHVDVSQTVAQILQAHKSGYARVKIKISSRSALPELAEVESQLPSVLLQDLPLAVDANGCLGLDDIDNINALNLIFIEQPFGSVNDHIVGAKEIETKVCLDELVTDLVVVKELVGKGAANMVNVKPARTGSISETMAIYDWCVANDTSMMVGSMFETGIGRALNVDFASLVGFDFVGDLAPASRYFIRDITAPLESKTIDGKLFLVPANGDSNVDRESLDACTTQLCTYSKGK